MSKTINTLATRQKKSKFNNDSLAGFLFASPFIVGFLLFNLYPIIMSAYYSFTNFSAIKKPVFIGFENYIDLFNDQLFYKSLYNTIFYTVFSVPLIIIISIIIASLLNMNIKFRCAVRAIFFIPSIVPIVAGTMIWIWLMDPTNGYINKFLALFGIPAVNWLGDYKVTKISLIAMTLWGIGTTIVLFLAAIQDIPKSTFEAADIDGAGAFSKFINITIPSIVHIISYQIILAVINSFQYFTQAYVIIGSQSGKVITGNEGGPQQSLLMYPLYLFYNAFNKLNMGKASAMSWILFIIVGILTFFIIKLSKKWSLYD